MQPWLPAFALTLALPLLCTSACSDTNSAEPADSAVDDDAGAARDSGQNPSDARRADAAADGSSASTPAPAADCGDGLRSKAEACDDRNQKDGDGCSANCLHIEPGFSCFPAGSACRSIARCGDGVVTSSEPCDDGNRSDGDGCSASCKLEIGYKCEASPSSCQKTLCGDKKREGAESCDDGNAMPFDGCTAECQAEPKCGQDGCTSECGDGLVLNEACDDGNRTDGDGCSGSCQIEAGFQCSTDPGCSALSSSCVQRVPVIFRDFAESHSDFEVGCGQLTTGVVASKLDAAHRPVLANGSQVCIASASSFQEWYTAGKNNATIASSLLLYPDGKGGFVNRHGAHGEKWQGPSASYDGTPLFFPIDNAPQALNDMRYRAKIGEMYGYDNWPWEDSIVPNAPAHNFHFTTEVVYWFRYDASAPSTLEFLGDDDVWVFINDTLAVDLGGPHVTAAGTVTLDPTSAAKFGLRDGKVYEIRVFHAERKVDGSTFKLTLRGFSTSRSDCAARCGDGVVAGGEECDDGVNDGGYEECAAGCTLGASCGDGVLQSGEDCDDGNRLDGDACGSSCRNLVLL
jgi:fibro-slime domain-containing protein